MTFQIQINGHPGYLPEGTHKVKIKRAGARLAKSSGNQQLELELEAVEGDHEGKIARSWITQAPGTEVFWVYFVRAAFPEANGNSVQFEPEELVDREVMIKVESPDDAEYPKVTHYYPAVS
jgi:hypothetical protein